MADTKTERQKVKEITDRLEEGIKELFESEKFKNYLSTMSKFHNYSFRNSVLISMQKPDATLLAGFRAWEKNFQRHVKKGEKGIRILAPTPIIKKEEQEMTDPVTGEPIFDEHGEIMKEEVEVKIPAFSVVSVFDVSQTYGEPLPDIGVDELRVAVQGFEDFKKAVENVSPVPIKYGDIPGSAKGRFSRTENDILIQEGMSESQTVKTMIHEVAHSMLHNKDVDGEQGKDFPAKDKNTREVEAESVAYTVCQRFGIDTSDYSFGYIAGWSKGREMKELKSSLETIRETSSELIKGIEAQLNEMRHERENALNTDKEPEINAENTREPVGMDDVVLKFIFPGGEDFEVLRITNKTQEEMFNLMREIVKKDDKSEEGIHERMKNIGIEFIPIIKSGGLNENVPQFNDIEMDFDRNTVNMGHHLSINRQAENIINRLEFAGTAFSDDERKLIINHAFKLNNLENTKKLAERIYNEKTGEGRDTAAIMAEAQAEIDALPDPEIGISEMEEYGYVWNEMLPLTLERAVELFDNGQTVYLLHTDGAETLVEGREQLEFYEGICGIEKKDWENERNFREMKEELSESFANKEAQLLYGASDKFGIYQLKDSPELRDFHFEGTETLKQRGIVNDTLDEIKLENYNLTYVGDLSEVKMNSQGQTLEEIFGRFNYEHPADFKGHSASVSDVIVLHENGVNSAHFIDTFGFTELPGFMRELEGVKENDREKGIIMENEGATSGHDDQKPEKPEYDFRMELNKAAYGTKSDIVAEFKEKTDRMFNLIERKDAFEIEEIVKDHVKAKLDEYGIDAKITDIAVVGSRCRGLEGFNSDLDVAVEFSTNENGDILFDRLNEDGIHIGDVKIDISPVIRERNESLDSYLPVVEDYLEGVRAAREQEPISIFNIRMNDEERWYKNISGLNAKELCKAYAECGLPFVEMGKYGKPLSASDHAYIEQSEKLDFSIEFNDESNQITIFDGENFEKLELDETIYSLKETEVSLSVAECSEFHNLGEFYENIPTVDEAIALWNHIPPERRGGSPAITISIHTQDEDFIDGMETDIVNGKIIDLEMLEYTPAIKYNPKANEVIAELIEKLPDLEIRGGMSGQLKAKLSEKGIITDKTAEQNNPLEKIEEAEEENCNMIDGIPNNGAEKKKNEQDKQEKPAGRKSIKERLAEKRKEASGQKKEDVKQQKNKKMQR